MKNYGLLAALIAVPIIAAGLVYDQRDHINVFGTRKGSFSEAVNAALQGQGGTDSEGLTFRQPGSAETPGPSQPAPAPEQPVGQSADRPAEQPPPLLLFYRKDCPHCQKVEQFIRDNGLAEHLPIKPMEVTDYSAAQQGFFAAAKACGIPEDKLGVPLLQVGSHCLSGDQEIIDFFKAIISQNAKTDAPKPPQP